MIHVAKAYHIFCCSVDLTTDGGVTKSTTASITPTNAQDNQGGDKKNCGC